MSVPTVFDLDVRWSEGSERRGDEEEITARVARYHDLLAKSGETILSVLSIPDKLRTPAQKASAGKARRGEEILRAVATHRQALDVIAEDPDIDQIDDSVAKKRFQAGFLLAGFSLTWLALVDVELPGEGLKATDYEIIVQQALAEGGASPRHDMPAMTGEDYYDSVGAGSWVD